VAYTGTVTVVASPSDDFTYEATIKVQEPVATTGFYFTVSSAAGTVTNAWRVFWVASPKSATGSGTGSVVQYTDADAIAAVSNVLGTAAWVDVGTDSNDVPTYADVLAIAGGTDSVTNAYRVEFSFADSNTWDAVAGTRGSVSKVGRQLAFKLPNAYSVRGGLTSSVAFPAGPWASAVRYYEIAASGVTSAKILDETITLADISDAAEATLVARAGNVDSASNTTYSAGTTQAFDVATANTATIGTGSVARLNVTAPELSEDGMFLDAGSWTYDTNYWTLGFGALYYQSSGTSHKTIYRDIDAIAGRTYTVTYELYLDGVGVRFTSNVGGNAGTPRLADGAYTDTIVAGTNGLLTFTVAPLLGGEVYALVWNVDVRDANSEIVMTNGVINVGGRTVTWDKIALWDSGTVGGGTSTNSTHLGGVAAALYATDVEAAALVTAHNTNASAHTARFALKQDAATAATDAELSAHATNAAPHAAQFAAKQPIDADLTKLATNNGGSLTNLQPFRTAWKLAYGNGSAQWTEIALGASGQYLRSAGPSSAPSWYTPNLSATATNVYMADLLDTFTNGNFVVGDGTNLTQRTVAQVKTILGTDTVTGVPDLASPVTNGVMISTGGTSWAAVSLATAQSILGIGGATNVQFADMQMSGTSNDVAVSHGGTTWTNEPFLDVLNTVVAGAGGWYSFNIDAQTIDGLDSGAFLQTTASIDALSDVETNGVTAGDTLIWDGSKFAPGTLATDTNALEALWQADDATLSNAVALAWADDDTALSNALVSAYGAADTVVSNAVVAGYGAADTSLSNAMTQAFLTGYTNLVLSISAGDAANSNDVTAKVASYLKKDGSVAMTGNLNMGGHSITNIAAASLGFAGGGTISAAKVATWDATATASNLFAKKAADLTQFTVGGASGQVFKSNGSGGGAWSDDSTSASSVCLVQVFASGSQTITASNGGTWQSLSWTESIDIGSNFALTQFTAPETAEYRASVSVPIRLLSSSQASTAYVRLRKNGTTPLYVAYAALSTISPVSVNRACISFSIVLSLTAGDILTLDAAKSGNDVSIEYSVDATQAVMASMNVEKL
jgi:hypothetical protein